MFDPQTPAGRLIDRAKEEALKFSHLQCGTEHLLLAMLASGDSLPNKVLRQFGLDYLEVCQKLSVLQEPGVNPVQFAEVKLNKQLLQMVKRVQKKRNNIGEAEYLLIGLLEMRSGLAREIFKEFGVKPSKVKQAAEWAMEASVVGQKEKSLVKKALPIAEVSEELEERTAAKKSIADFFDSDVQEIINIARTIATEGGSNDIGTEHILLAILEGSQSNARQALIRAGLSSQKVRTIVEKLFLESPAEDQKDSGFSFYTVSALKLGYAESRQTGMKKLDIDHLLMGMLRESESNADMIFQKCIIDQIDLRQSCLASIEAKSKLEFQARNEPLLLGEPKNIEAEPILDADAFRVISSKLERVFQSAAVEAVALGDSCLGSVHLLIAIVDSANGGMKRTLFDMGIDSKSIRPVLSTLDDRRFVRTVAVPDSWKIQLPLHLETNAIVSKGSDIAERRGSPQVQAEHLLAAMIDFKACVAHTVLLKLNIDTDNMRSLLFGSGSH